MGIRKKVEFANGEYYHIFNRGVDKRVVFPSPNDIKRFFKGMEAFNTIDPIGSIHEYSFCKEKEKIGNEVPKQQKLVNFVCYCLNPNHYHFILEQVSDNGITKFMHKLGVGYTNYFNEKNKRKGVLFQGPFKRIHVDSNEYLLHLSAYVNLNNKVHRLGNEVPKSSWGEYMTGKTSFCKKGIILDQFDNVREYKDFAESSLVDIRERKDMEKLLLE